MNTAELLTRGTVWLALVCYAATLSLQARGTDSSRTTARLVWLAGCVFFLAHVAAAFHFYHHWSHAMAAEDTRRQTLERVRINFSGGIYFNYLFALVWLADCAGWWIARKFLHETYPTWRLALHLFFLFMIFNATVVFGHGWAKLAGAMVCGFSIMALRRVRFPA